jgi:hypothetical protein
MCLKLESRTCAVLDVFMEKRIEESRGKVGEDLRCAALLMAQQSLNTDFKCRIRGPFCRMTRKVRIIPVNSAGSVVTVLHLYTLRAVIN